MRTFSPEEIRHHIVIGSSRGLGAALVKELLKEGTNYVIGVARTGKAGIESEQGRLDEKRYQHVELDITSDNSVEVLKEVCSSLPPVPVCVYYNAAFIVQDIERGLHINVKLAEESNKVQIDGLGHTLKAFEGHLLGYGGVLVGLSSVWSLTPPFSLPWISYPATKAYLDMTMRCLRIFWKNRVYVMTVHLGHLDNLGSSRLPRWLSPTYDMTAEKIVRTVSGKKMPRDMYYPPVYRIFYNYLFRIIPERVFTGLFLVLQRFARAAEGK